MARVFISYSSKDRPFAQRLESDLQGDGLEVLRDEVFIGPGESIVSKISDAIESSDYLILLVSGHSMQSRWVHKELDLALSLSMDRDFPIIPVRINKTPVPAKLRDIKYVDFADRKYDDGVAELKNFFKKQTRKAGDSRKAAQENIKPTSGSCEDCLKSLSNSTLRQKITNAFNIAEIGIIWYDLLGSQMQNEVPGLPIANAVIELIERCKARRRFDDLLTMVCAERPSICP